MERHQSDDGKVVYIQNKGIKYVQFKNLMKYGDILTHCFTTRIGGVSTGECCSLNFAFNRNDKRENVEKNFKRLCNALDINYDNLVFSNQVHDIKVQVVDEKDKGKGIIKESDIIGYDALVTNKRQVPLVTFYADCVPVLIYDKRNSVIAAVHSGWRGTVGQIARETILKMKQEFGSCSEDMEVAIGPSIGSCCFEVGEEVYNEFVNRIKWSKSFCNECRTGKWYIDLQQIIKRTLLNEGVKRDRILVSDVCTKCNNDMFFSHRGEKGKTGCMVAIIQLN